MTDTTKEITKEQYLEALEICHKYRKQINDQVREISDQLIREFIQENLGQMSTRCFNMLESAIRKGYFAISELTVVNLMKMQAVGTTTIKEFQKLTTKN